ncbi:MAG: hypothetical protein N2234_00190 [Planctomycetota bacterium]|nr:hypothetical protein [Planctomycetota bacterium]
MATIQIRTVENKTGTSVTFEVIHLKGTPYGARVYFRDSSEFLLKDWQHTETIHPVSLGSLIEVTGLFPAKTYEFYPVTVTEKGEESAPGNFLRLCIISADRITRLAYAIADELSFLIPRQNIFVGAQDKNSSNREYPVVTIFEEGISRKPLFNTLSLLSIRFRLLFTYDSLSSMLRSSKLNSILDTIAEKFATDISMFSSIEGYYDTQIINSEWAKEEKGDVISTASLTLECLIKS